MKLDAADLDFMVKLNHHSDPDATMKVSITRYGDDEPQMDVEVEGRRISLVSQEIDALRTIMDRYTAAQEIMAGERKI